MLHRLMDAHGHRFAGRERFADLEGSAHRTAVEQLAADGIIQGRVDGSFGPREPIRREQMASMLVRLLEDGYGHHPRAGSRFSDVRAGSVHESNIRKLVGARVTQGVSGSRFAPADEVSRAQMATFVMRTADVLTRDGRIPVPPSVR